VIDADWKKIRHFTAGEPWGDVSKIDFRLVYLLDRYRHYRHKPIYVTCGTQGKHALNSQHYVGRAVDIVIDSEDDVDEILMVMRFPFTGIGVYPEWRHPACKNPLGLHLDVREVDATIARAQWIGLPGTGGTNYFPLNSDTLKKYSDLG
jgi:uncharacterized protein YcbK (DUF882 family)